jgi:ribonuclease HII
MPDFTIEHSMQGIIAGVDEAGRGPWAGPVVAAAVIAKQENFPPGIDDSKKLSADKREKFFKQIMQSCIVGIGLASPREIDDLNILQATMLAMQRAISNLPSLPDCAIIDGNKTPQLPCKSIAIIKGDAKSLSIAAASIIAKVTRDRIMRKLADEYPFYGWDSNSGYGTKKHQDGLAIHGITSQHRLSFKPIKIIMREKAVL